MNRRSFFRMAGAAALTVIAAPLFVPAERLAYGVPKRALAAPVWRGPITLSEYAMQYPPAESHLMRMFTEMEPVLEDMPFQQVAVDRVNAGSLQELWNQSSKSLQRGALEQAERQSVISQYLRSAADLRGPRDYLQSTCKADCGGGRLHIDHDDSGHTSSIYLVTFGPELVHGIVLPEEADA